MIRHNTILLVDDDPLQLVVLESYFKKVGVINIHTAGDAVQALEILNKIENHEITLIVSDIQMPNMDGLEFLRHLKNLNYRGELALVSGIKTELLDHAAQLAKLHCLNLVGHIIKPLTGENMNSVFLNSSETKDLSEPDNDLSISSSDLVAAIENREIIPHYQPKHNLISNTVLSAEALARWTMHDGEKIPPGVFIELAAENGLLDELTFYLFSRVLDDLQQFVEIRPEIKIAVNLESTMISNVDLPDKIISMINQSGLTANNISFEITERSIMNLDAATLEVLSRLRILGFDIAIDDFGTGSSNIQTLKNFPYSELKIDRAFITNVTQNRLSEEIVRASVKFALELNMCVVAEGIEDINTLNFIRGIGIETAQGFLMSKPMSANDFASLLKFESDLHPEIKTHFAC